MLKTRKEGRKCAIHKRAYKPLSTFLGTSWPWETTLRQKASMFDSRQTLWLLVLRKTVWKQRLAYKSDLHFPCLFVLYVLQPLAYMFLSLTVLAIPFKFFREFFLLILDIYLDTLYPFCLFHFVPVAGKSSSRLNLPQQVTICPQNSALLSSFLFYQISETLIRWLNSYSSPWLILKTSKLFLTRGKSC